MIDLHEHGEVACNVIVFEPGVGFNLVEGHDCESFRIS